jgi:hypothetical protein
LTELSTARLRSVGPGAGRRATRLRTSRRRRPRLACTATASTAPRSAPRRPRRSRSRTRPSRTTAGPRRTRRSIGSHHCRNLRQVRLTVALGLRQARQYRQHILLAFDDALSRHGTANGMRTLLAGRAEMEHVPGMALPMCQGFDPTVRTRPGRLSALSVLHRKSVLYGAFVRARSALNSPKWRFQARADAHAGAAAPRRRAEGPRQRQLARARPGGAPSPPPHPYYFIRASYRMILYSIAQ